MKCYEIKIAIEEALTVSGISLTDEMETHIKECDKCEAVYNEMKALSQSFAPLNDYELTEAESERTIAAKYLFVRAVHNRSSLLFLPWTLKASVFLPIFFFIVSRSSASTLTPFSPDLYAALTFRASIRTA